MTIKTTEQLREKILRLTQDYKDDDEGVLDSPYITDQIIASFNQFLEANNTCRLVEKPLPNILQIYVPVSTGICAQEDMQRTMLQDGFGIQKDGKTYAIEELKLKEK